MNKRSKKNKGFTLIESIVSLLTITILTALLISVTDAAKESYIKSETNSQGQILCSILTNAIQDELRFALTPEKYGSPVSIAVYNDVEYLCYHFTYFSESQQMGADCAIVSYDGKAYIIPSYSSLTNITEDTTKQALTSNSSYVFDTTADVQTYYCPSLNAFYIELTINDGNGGVVIKNEFVVKPLNN